MQVWRLIWANNVSNNSEVVSISDGLSETYHSLAVDPKGGRRDFSFDDFEICLLRTCDLPINFPPEYPNQNNSRSSRAIHYTLIEDDIVAASSVQISIKMYNKSTSLCWFLVYLSKYQFQQRPLATLNAMRTSVIPDSWFHQMSDISQVTFSVSFLECKSLLFDLIFIDAQLITNQYRFR